MSLPRLREMRAQGEKITLLTAYDATFAAVADAAGVDCILVGDSLGMVCQGLTSTVGVSLENMHPSSFHFKFQCNTILTS